TTYGPLTPGVEPGDPFTPLLQAYAGDRIRLRVQVGAHEEEHNFTINGLKWLHDPFHASSGWRNSGPSGISEYFDVDTPIVPDLSTGQSAKTVDYRYAMGAQTEDLWNGIWGLLRSYGKPQTFLRPLPNNLMPAGGWTISNLNEFSQACPKQKNGAAVGIRRYKVTAVRAMDVLHKTFGGPGLVDGLVYNSRTGPLGLGPLVDPTALMYVRTDDLVRDPVTGKPTGLRPGTPIDPLVLRASAGECIKVDLENALPEQDATKPGSTATPDLPGFNALPPIIQKQQLTDPISGGPGYVTFNANDIRPSSLVGLHPQLVAADIRKSDGFDAGNGNSGNLVAPGQSKQYTWYAGSLSSVPDGAGKVRIVADSVEFGASNLMPADAIKGSNKGLVGALVIEPPGATWVVDPTSHAAATISFPDGTAAKSFREFVTVLQDDVNLRYGGKGSACLTAATLDCAVGNVLDAGGRGFPDDAQDSGQKGINYGSEPA
ncbi:MAG: hypothetical protein MUQ32_17940, partial [Chloroflexi bacterium]|nr:hypothetical protein [Chloroflexota bacterium]